MTTVQAALIGVRPGDKMPPDYEQQRPEYDEHLSALGLETHFAGPQIDIMTQMPNRGGWFVRSSNDYPASRNG